MNASDRIEARATTGLHAEVLLGILRAAGVPLADVCAVHALTMRASNYDLGVLSSLHKAYLFAAPALGLFVARAQPALFDGGLAPDALERLALEHAKAIGEEGVVLVVAPRDPALAQRARRVLTLAGAEVLAGRPAPVERAA